MSTRILAISPTPANLVLAACFREHWDSLRIVSRQLIGGELKRYASIEGLSRVDVFLDGVASTTEVRKGLLGLVGKGVSVEWVVARSSDPIRAACGGISRVVLHEAQTQEEFLSSKGVARPPERALFRALRDKTGDLHDYLRYKLTLALMPGIVLEPLMEAIAQLVAFRQTGGFNASKLPDLDRASFQKFRDFDFTYLEGHAPPIQELKDFLPLAGRKGRNALILGNTGTGKEAVAFFLHEYSDRRKEPYVAINCAGFEKDLLLAELFGYKKGAFTGALVDRKGLVEGANGGTLFLDEIGDMSLSVQAALLRFLETRRFRRLGENQEREVSLRLIAAGQPDLRRKMDRGEFRKDLFYRLAQVELETPDLAMIRADIPVIIKQLLYKWNHEAEDTVGIHHDLQRVMQDFNANREFLDRYSWPGNVRELSTLVRRIIDYDQPAFSRLAQSPQKGTPLFQTTPGSLFPSLPPGQVVSLDAVKREYVLAVVKANPKMTKREIGERLGIAQNTLTKALRESSPGSPEARRP